MLSRLMEPAITAFLFAGSALVWWTMKRECVRHDWPLMWDVADLAAGLVGAIACFVLVRPLIVYRATAQNPVDPTVFAARSAAAFGLALFLGFWLASMYVEKETDRELPATLDPIEERVYETHFAIVPVVGPRDL